MALGIVVALEREARIVRRVLCTLPVEIPVSVRVSGMGALRAHAAARSMVRGGARVLLSAGFAGALDTRIAAGELLIPDRVHDDMHDIVHACASAQALREALSPLGALHAGVLASVARPVVSAAGKRALGERLGAIGVDMESAAIGEVARGAGVGFAVLRAVSDVADLDLPHTALAAVGVSGRVDAAGLAWALLRRPGEVVALMRLAVGARRAARSLERALPAALKVLCDCAVIDGVP